MIAVPLPARSGAPVGAITLHTVAPHEFHPNTVNFLAHTASLLAGAIETARLYEEARLRVDALTTLSRISQEIAAAQQREDLYEIATQGVRDLLQCEMCCLYEVNAENGDLELAAASPDGVGREPRQDIAQHTSPTRPSHDTALNDSELVAEVTSSGERLGSLRATASRPWREAHKELLDAIANQVAVALKRAELIERLTEENLVRDLFEALLAGRVDVAEARARAARCDLNRDHVIVRVEPLRTEQNGAAWLETAAPVEAGLRAISPRTIIDLRADALESILPLVRFRDKQGLVGLDHQLTEIAEANRVVIGRSDPHSDAAGSVRGVREASHAAEVTHSLFGPGGMLAYHRLGAYRYLVQLSDDEVPEDRYRSAVTHLVDYDARHRTQLLETLERYLEHRGGIQASAEDLHVHPNTVRQRLERIEEQTDLHLGEEDLLALEIMIKLARLGRL